MHAEVTERSTASPATLWAALVDLQAWPVWCPTFTAVQPDGPVEPGTCVRVVQPGLRPAEWTIEDVVPGRSFRWSNRGPGFVVTTDHVLERADPGTTVRLSLAVTGPMAWAASLVAGRPMRRYLRQQARALAALLDPAA